MAVLSEYATIGTIQTRFTKLFDIMIELEEKRKKIRLCSTRLHVLFSLVVKHKFILILL